MSHKNKLAFLLSLLAFVFLVPGIFLSMLTIKTHEAINSTPLHFGLDVFSTANSILKTISNLYHAGNIFVACMIFLFSVIVPVVKGILLIYILLCGKIEIRKKIFAFIKSIGKWSMCDVFVVATFLVYLSTGTKAHETQKTINMLGIDIDFNLLFKMSAHLEIGFYCFLTYCLLSLIALQLYEEY